MQVASYRARFVDEDGSGSGLFTVAM